MVDVAGPVLHVVPSVTLVQLQILVVLSDSIKEELLCIDDEPERDKSSHEDAEVSPANTVFNEDGALGQIHLCDWVAAISCHHFCTVLMVLINYNQ